MRKTCLAILGMVLGATMLGAPVSASGHGGGWAALRPNCQPFSTTKTSRKETATLDKWVDVKTQVNARQCFAPATGNRWVDPVTVEFSYNTEGSHESCGFFDTFEGVRYDLYLKDSTERGRNFHLPTVVLDCDTDTTGWTIESLRDAPSDFRVCTRGPQWKTEWTIKIDNANDQSGNHGGTLWNFIGPVKDECNH